MTYALWKCHCGYETRVDTDRMPPIQERCEFCHPPKVIRHENTRATVPGRMTFTVLERKF